MLQKSEAAVHPHNSSSGKKSIIPDSNHVNDLFPKSSWPRLVEEEYEVWNRFPFFPICSLYVDCSRWEWDLPQSCRINWPRCKTPHFSWVIHNNFKSLSFLLTCNRQIGSNSNKRVECHDQSCFYTGTVHANLTRDEINIKNMLKKHKKKKSAWLSDIVFPFTAEFWWNDLSIF